TPQGTDRPPSGGPAVTGTLRAGGWRPRPRPFAPRRERPVKLRHATPARNLPGILRRGLLCAKSQGRRPVVWLHAPAASGWAVLHTVRRQGGRVEGAPIAEADVPRAWLRRNRRGLVLGSRHTARTATPRRHVC